jgi:hypothetical protein
MPFGIILLILFFIWYNFGGLERVNLSEPAGYFTYSQVKNSTILRADYIAFICFVWLSDQKVTFSLYTINRLVFITEVKIVYCGVRNESLYNTDTSRP